MMRSYFVAFVMPGRLPNRPEAQPSQISDISSALFRRQRFWMKMATYRPLIILAGIWVVLLAIALLAYDQLMYTVSDTEQTATRSSETALYPHQRSSGPASPADPASPANDDSEVDTADGSLPAAVEVTEVDGGSISSWSLAALVMTCAVGCWFISRQITASPRPKAAPKKRTGKPRSPAPPPVGTSRRTVYPNAPKGPKRLAPYNPNQPLSAPSSGSSPVPTSSSFQGMAAASSPDGSSPSDVTVVAEEFQHRLDWPEESLVNTADERQRRSLSSYL